MPSAVDVACEFLRLAQLEPDEPEPLTPMRLHKLVYYAQGWSLAFRGEPLFEGRIEAWQHGPVAPELAVLTKDVGPQPVPAEAAAIGRTLAPADAELVKWVWSRYGRFSASELRNMTHRERPWLEARGGLPDDAPSRETLAHETMRRFFRTEHDGAATDGVSAESLRKGREDARTGRTLSLEEIERELGRATRGSVH